LAGQVKSQWGKLTDDDLKNIAGKRQQLVGKLQERYGVLRGDIEKQINEWIGKVQAAPSEPAVPATEPAATDDADKTPLPAQPTS
jgi:uncharacterized protein YjbJ (UPF0337 family)